MTILLNNISTSQDSEAFISRGGPAIVLITATEFGGATVELQIATEEDTLTRWVALTSGSFTADGSVKLNYLAPGMMIRASVTGTTGPTDGIFVSLSQ